MDTTENNTRNWIITGVIIILIIALAWLLIAKSRTDSSVMGMASSSATTTTIDTTNTGAAMVNGNNTATEPSNTTDVSATTPAAGTAMDSGTMAASDDMVAVSGQTAGNSVMLSSVSLTKAGWVAIQDADGNHTLGAAWFPAGKITNVPVVLIRNTVAGSSYRAVMFYDNGDKQFQLHGDSMISGGSSMATFSAQ